MLFDVATLVVLKLEIYDWIALMDGFLACKASDLKMQSLSVKRPKLVFVG